MRRKVIQHGPVTLTISLPASWIKKNNIRKGEELNVEEQGGILKVCKENNNLPEKSKEFNLDGLTKETIRTLLGITFKSGYDKLIFSYSNSEMIPFIQERVNSSLLGCEIIEQLSNSCTIKYLHIDSSKEFDNMVKRMFLILEGIGERILEV